MKKIFFFFFINMIVCKESWRKTYFLKKEKRKKSNYEWAWHMQQLRQLWQSSDNTNKYFWNPVLPSERFFESYHEKIIQNLFLDLKDAAVISSLTASKHQISNIKDFLPYNGDHMQKLTGGLNRFFFYQQGSAESGSFNSINFFKVTCCVYL